LRYKPVISKSDVSESLFNHEQRSSREIVPFLVDWRVINSLLRQSLSDTSEKTSKCVKSCVTSQPYRNQRYQSHYSIMSNETAVEVVAVGGGEQPESLKRKRPVPFSFAFSLAAAHTSHHTPLRGSRGAARGLGSLRTRQRSSEGDTPNTHTRTHAILAPSLSIHPYTPCS